MGILQKTLWQLRLGMNGEVLGKLSELRRIQHLGWNTVEELRRERLEELIRHAHRNTTYYRELFEEHGLVDGNVVNLSKFSDLPLLDKSVLRGNGEALRSRTLSAGKWRENTSGGSTGEPVKFLQDINYLEWSRAAKILFDEWSGYSLGERKAVLWGSERDLLVGRETFKTYLGRFARNEVVLNSFRMSPEQMREHVNTLNSFKPIQLRAYVQSVYELARFIEAEGLKVHSPKAIMTSAGTLNDLMRTKIETIFQTTVFNRYGSREVGDIACEDSQHNGLYVSPNHIVEILDGEGRPVNPGEVGEIVVTLLTNFAMPLIRYRIGDMGVWAAADDTNTWPRLESVTGRVTDTFVTRDGTQIHGEYFTHLFYYEDWVEKFQVIQEDYCHIIMKVVPRDRRTTPAQKLEELRSMEQDVKTVMGECKVDFEFLDAIPATASGKYRYTISKVGSESPSKSEVGV